MEKTGLKRPKHSPNPIFHNLCSLAFRNGIPNPDEARAIFEATPRTIRNWLNGQRPCSNWAIAALRNHLQQRQWSELKVSDFQDQYQAEKSVARLHKDISIADRNKMLTLIYQHIDQLEKCVFFAREPGKEDPAEPLLGCLIDGAESTFLIDQTHMTASRRLREKEIQGLFRHLHANQLEDKLFYIAAKIPDTKLTKLNEAIELIVSQPLAPLKAEGFIEYIQLIRNNLEAFDPSEYYWDGGFITLAYIAQDVYNRCNEFIRDFVTNIKIDFANQQAKLFYDSPERGAYIYRILCERYREIAEEDDFIDQQPETKQFKKIYGNLLVTVEISNSKQQVHLQLNKRKSHI